MKDLLVDTHVLLWAASTPERLNPAAHAALIDPARRIFVSSISAAEIEICKKRLQIFASDRLATIGGKN